MKKFSRNQKITIAGILITSLLAVTGLFFTSGSKFAGQSMQDSPSGIQIQGNGNTVNQLATYSWANKDSWQQTIQQQKTDQSLYTSTLQFQASSTLLPSHACLVIYSDVPVLYAGTGRAQTNVIETFSLENGRNKYKSCFSTNFMGIQSFIVRTNQPPQILEADLSNAQ
jgi:hypothetical protein